jgi:hypothetical protein
MLWQYLALALYIANYLVIFLIVIFILIIKMLILPIGFYLLTDNIIHSLCILLHIITNLILIYFLLFFKLLQANFRLLDTSANLNTN